MRLAASLAAVLCVAACATLPGSSFDVLYGPADATRYDSAVASADAPSYSQVIQPLLDKRCVVCHACNDAPCQFKATSWEGIARGASKAAVYDAARLLPAAPSRLGIDADKASEWRERGFFPVLNEHAATLEAHRAAGLMHRLLTLAQRHPLPDAGVVQGRLDFSLDRAASCPRGTEIDSYESRTPQGGMPFGMPPLSAGEHATLTRWLEMGAPAEPHRAVTPLAAQRVAQWERFFNGDSAKERLVARYAYEHLFLANLYFDDDPQRQYFKLVRSGTPPGTPVQLVRARRPVDDPGVARVYYRLVPERETIVAKTHMPYALGASRMARWRALFLDAPYTVSALPGYSAEAAANPFATFAALPAGARYRFMLDEAEFTIMGFIKGPVCRGQAALTVIRDRFWVSFLAPSDAYDQALSELLSMETDLLRLPTGDSGSGMLLRWMRYADLELRYLQARTDFQARALRGPQDLNLGLVWDGDGRNDNAALTVFRHFDSATVVKGFAGEPPETAWVIGYPLLERIHYLLVANYDVYGNVGHQLNSRLYMDFLRMEGEYNFLTLLPRAQREAVRDRWYRGEDLQTRLQVYGGPGTTLAMESGVAYRTADARRELLEQLRARLAPVLDRSRAYETHAAAPLREPLGALASLRGEALQWLPEAALLVVDPPGAAPSTFTLLRNTGQASVSQLVGERRALRPDENDLTVLAGVAAAYPNAFYRVRAADLPAFTAAVRGLRSEADYAGLVQRFGVRRNSAAFWALSDEVHASHTRERPGEAGVLDYNRLENR